MKLKKFETKRLFLVPTSLEDVEFILELLNSPKWLEYIGDRNVHTIDEAKKYITDKMIVQFERLGFGNYTLVRKSDNEKLGTCGLYDRPGLEGVDIGFSLLPAFERKGYALESASKLKEVAFKDFAIKTISAITTKDNNASQNLILKLGLEFIKFTSLPNDKELMLYQLNKD